MFRQLKLQVLFFYCCYRHQITAFIICWYLFVAIKVSPGVGKGIDLSIFMFIFHVNDLLYDYIIQKWINSGYSFQLILPLSAQHQNSLHIMSNIVLKYACKWLRYFNSPKSVFIVFSQSLFRSPRKRKVGCSNPSRDRPKS